MSSRAYDVLLKRLFPVEQGPVATRRSGRVVKFLSSSCRQAVEFTSVLPSSADLTMPREAYLMAMACHLHLLDPGRPIIGDSCIGHRHRMDALGHLLLQCWQHRTVPHDGLCRKLHGLFAALDWLRASSQLLALHTKVLVPSGGQILLLRPSPLAAASFCLTPLLCTLPR